MTAPVRSELQMPLEAALLGVQAALADLLAAAAEQRAALEAGDRERLDRVTQEQERLTARLEQAERRRMACMPINLQDSLAVLPVDHGRRVDSLMLGIREAVAELRAQHERNAALIQRSLELAGQTLQFIQRLMGVSAPTYGTPQRIAVGRSMLVDSRA